MSLLLLPGLTLQFDRREDGWWYSANYKGAVAMGERCALLRDVYAEITAFVRRLSA